jgi:hypothetical protein
VSSVRRCSWLLLALAVLCLGAPPAVALTSWVPETSGVRTADAAVVPGNIGVVGPDGYEPNDDAGRATPLRLGAPPQDHTIHAGEQDWYRLWTADGTGYVRIGSTGRLSVSSLLRPTDESDDVTELNGPGFDADLTEARIRPGIDVAVQQGADGYYLLVETPSAETIDYRISLVDQLPEDLIGATTPGHAAGDYLGSLLDGDVVTMYATSGIRLLPGQADALREQLFGRRDPAVRDIVIHGSPKYTEEEEFDSPVQHVIISHLNSPEDLRAWAFVVTCKKGYPRWVVTGVRRDTELTDAQVMTYVRAAYERMGTVTTTTTTPRRVVRWSAVVLILAVAALIVGGVLVVFRVRAARRTAKKGIARLVAVFGETTEWAGKTILFTGAQFVLEGHGVISAADVMRYDRDGHLVWQSEGTRAWVGAKAAATSPSGPPAG